MLKINLITILKITNWSLRYSCNKPKMITTISKEEKSPKGKKNFLILTSQKQIELFFFGYKTDLNG